MTSRYCGMIHHGVSVNQDGSLAPCCQYHTAHKPLHFYQYQEFCHSVRGQMQQDLDQDRPHAGCSKCYQEEELGLISLRNYVNNWHNNTETQVLDPANEIWDFELRLGNVCNLKCIMCHPGASSSIATERYQHNILFGPVGLGIDKPTAIRAWWESSEFRRFFIQRMGSVKRLNITGGEPFMIPAVFDLLNDIDNTELELSFNTNLTVINQRVIDVLNRFAKLSIVASLEGTGTMNDYLRYPSKWSDIVANLRQLRSKVPHARLKINHTFQHTSVYSLPDLVKFSRKNVMPLQLTMVQGMDFLTLDSVPSSDIAKFHAWVEQDKFIDSNIKPFLTNAVQTHRFDPDKAQRFRDYVATLDKIRGTNYNMTFCP